MADNTSSSKSEKNPRIENLRRSMEELELRVSSLEKEVEYEGLNLSLDLATDQIKNITNKAVENSVIRNNLWAEIEVLLQTLNEQHSRLKEVQSIAQENLEKYEELTEQRRQAEAREELAIEDIRNVIKKHRQSG